jgi:hypothetical protein
VRAGPACCRRYSAHPPRAQAEAGRRISSKHAGDHLQALRHGSTDELLEHIVDGNRDAEVIEHPRKDTVVIISRSTKTQDAVAIKNDEIKHSNKHIHCRGAGNNPAAWLAEGCYA